MSKTPVSRIYRKFNYPLTDESTALTGIRSHNNIQYITGFFGSPATGTSFVYEGNRLGDGDWHLLNFPDATGTNLYGPNRLSSNEFRIVGSYFQNTTDNLGCMYEGPLDGSGEWTTLLPPSDDQVLNTIAHSNAKDIVIGNYDTTLIQGKGFIYDTLTREYFDIVPNDYIKSLTAYGVWHNGCNHYTIAGSYSPKGPKSDDVSIAKTEGPTPDTSDDVSIAKTEGPTPDTSDDVSIAYLVDWNNRTHTFSNFTSFYYKNDPHQSIITHFDGISSTDGSRYFLTGDQASFSSDSEHGFVAWVDRDCTENFIPLARWKDLYNPGYEITSGNSVDTALSTVVGVSADTNGESTSYISFYIQTC